LNSTTALANPVRKPGGIKVEGKPAIYLGGKLPLTDKKQAPASSCPRQERGYYFISPFSRGQGYDSDFIDIDLRDNKFDTVLVGFKT
jgi:hypothetical protein